MSRALRIKTDELGPIAAGEIADERVGREFDRASNLVADGRARAEDFAAQSDLVETVYLNGFLRDVETANRLAISIASGDFDSVQFDAQSLGEHGDDPESVMHYLSTFVVQDPSVRYPFDKLDFPTTAVIPYRGKEHFVNTFTGFNPLSPYSFSPTFNPNVILPSLVDPQIRTFAELAELEAIDPGHTQQLMEAYRMAARNQKAKDAEATFKDPLVVRMVAIMPTGYEYMTDFVPQVEIKDGQTQSWDPYLLVNGALNESGNYLHYNMFRNNRAVYNRNGKEAALRVSRPLPGQVAEEQADALMPLVDHEMNRMGVILFPYEFHKKPTPSYSALFAGHSALQFGDGTKGITRGAGNVGGAIVGAGAAGWASADKRSENILGDRFEPQTGGRPVIYSIRFLTAQRDPDIAA